MKLAIVVQRYGTAINGGAELHARYIAEHLAGHVELEVLTTCASDYVTWRNELPEGVETVNGITVRRFAVKHEREPLTFGRQSDKVFNSRHSLGDELKWLDEEGPACPALVDHIARQGTAYDFCIFFSYRYYHAYHGSRAAGSRAILVPTAERDPAIGLAMFTPVFRGVRALMYNSPEERQLIQAAAGNKDVPSVVVGIGSNVPASTQPNRFRQKYGIREPFAIYVGRIDENKGCKELFQFFTQYLDEGGRLTLVLVGNSLLPVPQHPRIRHLGFLDDVDKFDAMAGAEVLIMPSYFESLSMVALEAWALGKPVIANGRCDVLKGQCLRSNAGLYYESAEEFVETLGAIERTRWLSASLGRNGRQFFKEHYDWPVIERKYLDMLRRLSSEPVRAVAPLPSWLQRRKADCPAASEVVAALPTGPARFDPSDAIERTEAPPDSGLPPRAERRERPRYERSHHPGRGPSGRRGRA